MTQRILSFYNKILGLACLSSDVEGRINSTLGGTPRPFIHDGKTLMLPVPSVQADPKKDNMIIFHPLHENVLRGETKVMERYRTSINLILNYRFIQLFGEIVQLATSPADHGRLTPEHLALMVILKDADEKTFAAYEALKKAMPPGDSEKCFVNIFLKKNAHIGRAYRRGAIVSFPLYKELVSGNASVFGVKLRKKDQAAFTQFIEEIFPGIAKPDEYSRGGESDMAPSLDALLKAVVPLAGQINSVVDTYSDVLPRLADLHYDDAWVDDAKNLDEFAVDLRMLPAQVGNEGSLARDVPGTPALPALSQPLAQVPAPVQANNWMHPQQPSPYAQHPQAVVRNEAGLLSMSSLMQNNPALAALAPMQPHYGYGQPMTGAEALRVGGASWRNPMTQFRNVSF